METYLGVSALLLISSALVYLYAKEKQDNAILRWDLANLETRLKFQQQEILEMKKNLLQKKQG